MALYDILELSVGDRSYNTLLHLDHLLLIGWQHRSSALVLVGQERCVMMPQRLVLVVGSFGWIDWFHRIRIF